MTSTTFFHLTHAAAVLASICILSNTSQKRSHALARAFWFFSIAVSLAVLLFVLISALGVPLHHLVPALVFQLLLYRGWVVIGVAVSAALLLLLNACNLLRLREAVRFLLASTYLLKGICVSVSLSFLATEAGKLAHRAEMLQFFQQSGYPAWFLYFIIAAETAGAIALLIPQTLLPATFGLAIIMLGAIRTHFHNHDPFSDSLEAVHLLILLACIVVMRFLCDELLPPGGLT